MERAGVRDAPPAAPRANRQGMTHTPSEVGRRPPDTSRTPGATEHPRSRQVAPGAHTTAGFGDHSHSPTLRQRRYGHVTELQFEVQY
ncbi:hypothetical protein GCM10023195_55790 [Actinoallomurus liliacearum]|uniref:Uncharacterized protein n=1 Tax=Actinoallomurus liliacearum TaxID=1080073 RepID=A0ABP8TSQ2_9ACTN